MVKAHDIPDEIPVYQYLSTWYMYTSTISCRINTCVSLYLRYVKLVYDENFVEESFTILQQAFYEQAFLVLILLFVYG